MESRVNYTVVGLFVIAMSVVFVVIFLWLSTLKHDKTYHTYVTFFKENVAGLAPQSQVRFNGVPVGYVQSFSLSKQNPQYVELFLEIEAGTPITTGTIATLHTQGITGVLYVGLIMKKANTPLLTAQGGNAYPVIASEPSFLVQLTDALPELIDTLKNVGKSMNALLDKGNLQSIQNTLKNVSKASNTLPNMMENLNQTLISVKQTSSQVNLTATTTRQAMLEGRVMVENFSDQVMPAIQQTLSNLSTAANNLHHFSNDLQRNPSMLIRGKQPAPLGPGER